jgi:hypothetical protein
MGVLGKLFYVVTGHQAQCEVRMDHVGRPLHMLLAEKEGRIWFNKTCLKLYQFEGFFGGVCLFWNLYEIFHIICHEICPARFFF